MTFFKKVVRIGLVLAGVVVLLVAILIGASLYDSRRSRLDWEAHRAAGVAKGIEYDVLALVPTAVPDDENFYATPLLAPLFTDEGYRKELEKRLEPTPGGSGAQRPSDRWLLGERFKPQAWQAYFDTSDWPAVFRPYEAMLEEITAAAARPAAVMPLPYSEVTGVSTEAFGTSLALASLYGLRAKAALSENRPEAAFADLQTLFRLSLHVTRDPFATPGLVAMAHFSRAMGVYWEGVVSRQWSDEQLSGIQAQLRKFDFLMYFHRTMQGERAVYSHLIEMLIRQPASAQIVSGSKEGVQLRPNPLREKGWLYRNLLKGDGFFDEFLLPQVDLVERRFDPEKSKAALAKIQRLKDHPKPKHYFVTLSLEAQCNIANRFAYAQTLADLGIIVAALERYHRQHGGYPETLAVLAPSHLEKLPHDLVTGEPLRYRRTDDGRFLLYGVGWNGIDDGGINGGGKASGDWGWPDAAF